MAVLTPKLGIQFIIEIDFLSIIFNKPDDIGFVIYC